MADAEYEGNLSIALSCAVPLWLTRLGLQGGPSDADFEWAREFSQTLGERGDLLLYRSKKKGETAEMFNSTAKAIAILAYLPGGITLFGQHYEAKAGAEEKSE